MFLTADDLRKLTGYAHGQRQIAWLKSHGWRYEQARSGRPVVLAKHAEEMLMASKQLRQVPQMNLAAIRKAA